MFWAPICYMILPLHLWSQLCKMSMVILKLRYGLIHRNRATHHLDFDLDRIIYAASSWEIWENFMDRKKELCAWCNMDLIVWSPSLYLSWCNLRFIFSVGQNRKHKGGDGDGPAPTRLATGQRFCRWGTILQVCWAALLQAQGQKDLYDTWAGEQGVVTLVMGPPHCVHFFTKWWKEFYFSCSILIKYSNIRNCNNNLWTPNCSKQHSW